MAREVGARCPMGAYLERERYVEFLDGAWDRGDQLSLVKTSCAIVAGTILGYCGHPLTKPWKADGSRGIVGWLNLGFNHPSWHPVEWGGVPDAGDVVYRGSKSGTNGHTQVVANRDSETGLWMTLDGGGILAPEEARGMQARKVKATEGTVTRLNQPKDILKPDGLGRVPAGWWRTELFVPTYEEVCEVLRVANPEWVKE